ncbi:protein chup1 chloroplastic [Phtheirospermum japonicum]|uniref:Protein chup1 chloroplastic n=1 Tax=Phtheirospermum japonicum TaxID=374723 RepID=A0A830BGJ8_9LAMI|nr:protein chup1 chloroplastic [Phtheirospermum japonicum]
MAVKEKRDGPISPVLIKFGVALAFSLGGIVCTFLRIGPSKSKPSLPSPGKSLEADSRRESSACALQNPVIGGRDDFLLAEVDHLINEHNKRAEHDECDIEIKYLRDKIKILEENERTLEIQLLEYYGLKEQETAVTELQNRLRIHNMEAKLYNLKIESLQSENKRLETQVADHAKVVDELEAAKAKIKLLRKKLRTEAEQNREQILILQEKVMKLQDEEKEKNVVEIDRDVEMEMRKMKDLESELEEMKKTNEGLKMGNYELERKLEYNEELTKEIEQLQADRCTDIEELVYLRWINACLRYEMRNYQPGPGETIARDLSKTLSPESEKKAKQLILEYANKEGSGDQAINIIDFDCDQWSTSQNSYFTGSYEPEDLPLDNSSANKTNKRKVFAKLMKLLRGKDDHEHVQTRPTTFERASSVDDIDMGGHFGSFGADGVIKTLGNSSSVGSSANSLDLQRSFSRGQKSTAGESSYGSRRASDDGSLSIFRRIDSITGYDDNLPSPHQDAQNGAKTELLKYAEALKKSHAKSSFRRRSASYSSF